MELILPKEIERASRVNPKSLILYGLPKGGKSTAVSKLKNALIIDTEDGSDFLDAMKIKIPMDMGPVGKMKYLKEIASKIREEGYPYDYVVIDTLSEVDSWSEWSGSYLYMNSLQGASFNRENNVKGGKMLKFGDPNYESVHSLPQGFGYRYSRQEMMDIFDALQGLGKICTIFIAHVADKVISRVGLQDVITRDLSFTGKVRDIISRKVDAVGYVYNKEGQICVSFKGSEDRIGGIRSPHIIGFDGPIGDWSTVFIAEEVEEEKTK